VPLRGTCRPSPERYAVRFTITPLGGAGRAVTKIVDAIVRYLTPRTLEPPAAGGPGPGGGEAGPARYYADGGEEPGRWRGQGAQALGLAGEVTEADLATVLAGRDPATGARLVSAQGSAGRRPKLGIGTETRRSSAGLALYDPTDAAAVLGLPAKQINAMLDVGTTVALSRLFPAADGLRAQPEGSYLAPIIDPGGNRWVTETELSRCEAALQAGTAPDEVAALGPPDELLPIGEAARLAGVTPRYLRRLAQRHETNTATIDAAIAERRRPRHAYLAAQRGAGGRWLVQRDELASYLDRRRPPAVRVGYDLTLTTEKSLGVLALLSGDPTRRAVLDAIRVGNDRALDWLERHAAITRVNGKPVPTTGWAIASFRHVTSRALDPFPHHHNVIANTVEDRTGARRTLDARGLYQHAQAASALATAEMRYQLTRSLGVHWRPGRSGGWEIAGISDPVLREFSRRRSEIDDALRELEDAIGHNPSLQELDRIVLKTRPAKQQVPVDELLDGWRTRATTLGFGRDQLAACLDRALDLSEPEPEALYKALAASDGICANLSIFNRADVLIALVDLPVHHGDEAQPLLVPAARLESLADGFLASRHVVALAHGRYTTREILAVQQRIVARYRHGLHGGAALVPLAVIDRVLARQPGLSDEQGDLVRAFCTSGHRTQCAIGRAGAGKTTTMAAARDVWQAAGWRVIGTAVKGEAARTLAAATGMPTETLAWHLAHDDPHTAPLDARTVLVVDEASTISDRDLDRLGWLAGQTGATLRLIGDPAQHGAVEAGGMFRVLCQRHPAHTPELTASHRVRDPHDWAAADAIRAGDIAAALDLLDAAGHLHIVDDELDFYRQALSRWWAARQTGLDHPIVDRRNTVRRHLNRLAHQLLQATGQISRDEIAASGDRRFSVGDLVIARTPDRNLHPPGRPDAYIRNGALGTVLALHAGDRPVDDTIAVEFDGIGTIDLPRSYFDQHRTAARRRRRDIGLDHAYAITSYAVQGATRALSTSRIDPTATRAEAYVDITRGQTANHIYLTPARQPLDGEALPAIPPPPIEDAVTRRLARSNGELTAWELHQALTERTLRRDIEAIGL
jgi:conjugative relaxase-like TrwC/TraI family protein